MKLFTDTDLSLLSLKDILDSIEVRPIFPEEKTNWDDLMKAHHYLSFYNLIGEGIRYQEWRYLVKNFGRPCPRNLLANAPAFPFAAIRPAAGKRYNGLTG